MARNKPQTILYRRKREKKTNYSKRLKLLLSQTPRLVARFTNKQIIAQVVSFEQKGDKVLAGVSSFSLKKLGWKYSYKNIPAAYLTGLLLGKKALDNGQKKAIFDTGFNSVIHKSKIYAFLKGVVDSGLEIPHGSEEVFPDEGRIMGKHIEGYAGKLKGNVSYDKMFGQYLKNNSDPAQMSAQFEELKKKILG
jgi:large subunit ribosomal protein L18